MGWDVRNRRQHGGEVVEDGDRPVSGDLAPPAPDRGAVLSCGSGGHSWRG